jgi:hypothetical protein
MNIDNQDICSLLREIINNQQILINKTNVLEEKLEKLEKLNINKKKLRIKSKHINSINNPINSSFNLHNEIKKNIQINILDIKSIINCNPSLKHIDIVFFSSLEFAFFVVLLETICDLTNIKNDITNYIYEEVEFCDNNYNIDIKSQLLKINGMAQENNSFKKAFPFKKKYNIDIDDKKSNIPLLGYFENQWCSSSYKGKMVRLYEAFCIKIIKQFAEWQQKYSNEITLNKLPKNLDYNECVLKIMGNPFEPKNITVSIDIICSYLQQIC